MKMKIEENGEKACIYTPYNPDFVREIKKIGGARWNGSAWEIPFNKIDIARGTLRKIYGEDDVSSVKKVDVRLTFNKEIKTSEIGGVTLYGKCIANAYSRDGGAKIGDDVAFTKGQAASGGSRKYPSTIIEEGSEAVVNNVPVTLLENQKLPDGVKAEIIESKENIKNLLAEKEQIEKRLLEIEEILKKARGDIEK